MAHDGGRASRDGSELMQGFPAPEGNRVLAVDVYSSQASLRWFMQHVRQVLGTADLRGPARQHGAPALPGSLREVDGFRISREGPSPDPTVAEVLRETHTDAFLVLHHGVIVHEAYFNGMTASTPHMWHSVSKSLVSCVAGNLVADGRLDLDELVGACVPELDGSAYGSALVRHLLDMQVGIDYSEDYADPDSDVNELDRIYGLRPPRSPSHPGSSYDYATTTRNRGRHGEGFEYVSLDANVLAWVMERATGVWLPDLIKREVWGKLGGQDDAYIALDAAGSAQAESGMCSSLRDLARLGLALSRAGELDGMQVVPAQWVEEIMHGGDREAFASHEEAIVIPGGSYKNNFWVARSGPEAAFMGSGIYGQMLYVNPRADLVVAKFSTQPEANDVECFRSEFSLCELLAEVL